jgi:hypothetical protein
MHQEPGSKRATDEKCILGVRLRDKSRNLRDLCAEPESDKPIVEVNPAHLVESCAPR